MGWTDGCCVRIWPRQPPRYTGAMALDRLNRLVALPAELEQTETQAEHLEVEGIDTDIDDQ